jgi:GMP synthase PP-ATPase subunit
MLLFIVSCGDDKDGAETGEGAIYRVVYETDSKEGKVQAHVSNGNGANIINEITKEDSKQAVIDNIVEEKAIYYTGKKVTIFLAQGTIYTDSIASLKMTVYKDGKEVYEENVTAYKEEEIKVLKYTVTE